ncbi:ATP-binding cassette domain-containing protein, partial [Acinetobacter baumannii]
DGRTGVEIPLLASQALSVRYGRRKAVDRATLSFPRHKTTAIVGPSGCGKSSYLQCLNRLHELVPGCTAEGDVCFLGRSIFATDADPVALR